MNSVSGTRRAPRLWRLAGYGLVCCFLAVAFSLNYASAQPQTGDIDALIEAAGSGDLNAVRAAIDSGIPVDAKDSLGVTALMEASYGGRLRMVNFLLEKGADANAKDEAGTSPLLEALGKDHADVALSLINAGADPNVRNGEDHTILYQAVELGQLDLIRAAIEKGAEVNPMTAGKPDENSRFNPLLLAVKKNDLAAARALVAAGADPNRPRFSPAFITVSGAAMRKNKKMLRLLLDAGAEPNLYVLAYAAEADLKLLRRLLKDPASRSRDALGLALDTAIKHKNRKAMDELINSGADINGTAREAFFSYKPPLVTAVEVGDARIVRLLIRAGANADKKSPGGPLPITSAAHSSRADLVKLLADAGANLEKAMEELDYFKPEGLKELTFEEWKNSPRWAASVRLLIKVGTPVEHAIISAVQSKNYAVVREWLPLVRDWVRVEGQTKRTSDTYDLLVSSADRAENCALRAEIRQMFQRKTGLRPPQYDVYLPNCK